MTVEARRAADEAELTEFGMGTLVWHAAMPEWTDDLAGVLGFPVDGYDTVESLVETLTAFGLAQCRTRPRADGSLGVAFWLPESRRRDIGEHLRRLSDVGEAVQRLHLALRAGGELPPAAAALLRVLDGDYAEPTGAGLLSDVDDLLAEGRAGEAKQLVSAARCLSDVIGGPLVASAERAQWRVHRAYRQADDTRALRYYQPRRMEALLAALIRGERRWALHMRGDGGVGKTMLLRRMASAEFAAQWDLEPTVFARIDFDHLDPRFPSTRPAELLLALAEDLLEFTASRDARRFRRRFDDAALELHELTESPNPQAEDVEEALGRSLDTFAQYLQHLGARVVLILDTCEELAKLHAPGAASPSVERTVTIITGLRRRFAGVRVVLAGRRWLAPPGRPSPVRDFMGELQAVELGAFTRDEAISYIERRDAQQVIQRPIRDAILARCAAQTGAVNPFELSSYVEWAVEDPTISAETLLSAVGDPYVEQRILGRLSDRAIRRALPPACELGRFNQEMLAAELVRRRLDPAAVFEELADQEWVRPVTYDGTGHRRIVEIDPNLQPRLRAVLALQSPLGAQDQQRLGTDIAALTLTGAVTAVPAEAVESALRLLPPQAAAEWWTSLDARIVAQQAWGWAAQVMPRAVAAVPPGPVSVRAAVRATQAVATLRSPGTPGIAGLWSDVLAWAGEHPSSDVADALTARAHCGRLAHDPSYGPRAGDWADIAAHAPLDALVAAGEAVQLRDNLDIMDTIVDLLAPRLTTSLRSGLTAAAALIVAGHALRIEQHEPALTYVERALETFSTDEAIGSVDWLGIARPRDRARLARVRVAIAAFERLSAIPHEQWAVPTAALADIDAERLASALLEHRLDWELPPRSRVTDTYDPGRQPTSFWHRETPPLVVTLSRLHVGHGDFAPATQLLRDRREAAISAGTDADTVRACDFALVDLCRRARSTEPTTALHRLVSDPDPTMRVLAWPALHLASGERPATPEEAGSTHVYWQLGGTLASTAPAEGQYLTGQHGAWLVDVHGPETATDDLAEPLATWQRAIDAGSTPREFLTDGSGAAISAAVRMALVASPQDAVARWLAGAPLRRVALAALAEGELIALRRPVEGVRLLAAAHRRFVRANDRVGASQARILLGLAQARCGVQVDGTGADAFVLTDPLWNNWSWLLDRYRSLIGEAPPPLAEVPLPELALLPFDPAEARLAPRVVADPGPGAVARAILVARDDDVRPGTLFTAADRLLVAETDLHRSDWPSTATTESTTVLVMMMLPDVADAGTWEARFAGGEHQTLVVPVRCRASSLTATHVVEWPTGDAALRAHHLGDLADHQHRPRAANPTVLYLVGTPVRTTGGPRMRLRLVDTDVDQPSPRERPATGSPWARLPGVRQLVGADELPRSPLTVLQCEPTDARPELFGALRARMFGLAADFVGRGSTAVLILPPLPDRTAAEAAALIYDTAGRSLADPEGPTLLFSLLHELRNLAGPAKDDVVLILSTRPVYG